MKKYVISSLICLLSTTAFATPKMIIQPQDVVYGNRVQLILSDDKPIQSAPDLSALQNDFVIRGQQQAEQTTIINGVRSETHQLILSLFPKKKGEIIIGPLDWNGAQLPAQTIYVSDKPAAGVSPNAPASSAKETSFEQEQSARVFTVTATLEPNEIYTGESTLYTIRLAENIGLTQAQIQTPNNAQYTLTPFGKDKLSQVMENGVPVRVYERSFLLTPHSSGVIELSGAGVLGLVPDTTVARSRRVGVFPDFFGNDDFFNQSFGVPQKEVYAPANNLTLTIQPKPADWKGWWLPSQKVTLTEQYKMSETVYVGQPIERYVLLSAQGVDGSKLPLVVQPVNQTIQAYANPEKRMVQEKESGPIGIEEIMFAIIPAQAGEITIPAIQVDWFNTKTHQKETAQLPAKKIQVLPVSGENETTEDSPKKETVKPNPIHQENVSSIETSGSENSLIPEKPQTGANITTPVQEGKEAGTAFKKAIESFGVFELCIILCVLVGFFGLGFLVSRRKKQYLYKQKEFSENREKKSLPDLYPFK